MTYYVLVGNWGSADTPGQGNLTVLQGTFSPTRSPSKAPTQLPTTEGQTNAPTMTPVMLKSGMGDWYSVLVHDTHPSYHHSAAR